MVVVTPTQDVIDDPALAAETERLTYESDMRVLAIYQAGFSRYPDAPPVPKALWRRIIRYRRKSRCRA